TSNFANLRLREDRPLTLDLGALDLGPMFSGHYPHPCDISLTTPEVSSLDLSTMKLQLRQKAIEKT